MVHLDVDATIELMPEPRIYLKAALHELVQSCVGIFSEAAASSVDYDHWLNDPVLLSVFQEVFAPAMEVLGVLSSLRPWRRKVPDPYLSSACAPLRLLIAGHPKSWHVHSVEDMRELSHRQLHQDVPEADWHVHLFGYDRSDSSVDRAPTSRSPATPAAGSGSLASREDGGGKSSPSTPSASSRSAPSRLPAPSTSSSAAPQPRRHRRLMLNNLCLTFRRSSIRYHIRKQLSSQRCSSPCLTFGRSTKGCRAILPLETLILRSDFYLVYMKGFTTAPSPTSRTCYYGQVSRQTFCHWRRKRSWDAPYVGNMSGYRTGLS